MKKPYVAFGSLLLILLSAISVSCQIVKAQYTQEGNPCPLAGGVSIISPSNTTYTSSPLLNVTMQSILSPTIYDVSVVYSVDGGDNVSLPVKGTVFPIEATITYANGTTIQGTSSVFAYYVIVGSVELQPLPEGSHNLTVYSTCSRFNNENQNWPAMIYANSTVYFTVNQGIPPAISGMTITNTTYNQSIMALNVTTDKPTSWIGYSLDGNGNLTLAGNTTLTSLSNGQHNLTIYANDTMGNMGSSGKIEFEVNAPSPDSPTLEIAIVPSVAVLAVLLFMAFRKRRNPSN